MDVKADLDRLLMGWSQYTDAAYQGGVDSRVYIFRPSGSHRCSTLSLSADVRRRPTVLDAASKYPDGACGVTGCAASVTRKCWFSFPGCMGEFGCCRGLENLVIAALQASMLLESRIKRCKSIVKCQSLRVQRISSSVRIL